MKNLGIACSAVGGTRKFWYILMMYITELFKSVRKISDLGHLGSSVS